MKTASDFQHVYKQQKFLNDSNVPNQPTYIHTFIYYLFLKWENTPTHLVFWQAREEMTFRYLNY